MTLEEIKSAHAAQIAEICREKHPSMTPGQIGEVQRRAAALIGDWGIAPLSRILNETTVHGMLATDAALTRVPPTIATTLEFKLNRHADELGIKRNEISPQREIEVAREVERMSDDERLNYVPITADALAPAQHKSHVAELEERAKPKAMTPEDRDEADDKYLLRTFGDTYLGNPFKRRELLSARDAMKAPTDGQRADAKRVDEYTFKYGDAPAHELSGSDMISRFRAEQNLKVK